MGHRWFCRTDEDFETFATEGEAIACADRALAAMREVACLDGWLEETSKICWGEIRAVATECDVEETCREQGCDSSNCGKMHFPQFDHTCDYQLMAPDAGE